MFLSHYVSFRASKLYLSMQNDTWRQNRWAIAPILHRKLNILNLPFKTVQDYPARLHASHCATLQRVGKLARCKVLHAICYLNTGFSVGYCFGKMMSKSFPDWFKFYDPRFTIAHYTTRLDCQS